jgi:acyl-CoA reductase-like NAD-dependent aldehyde dehydrogenase
LLGIGCTLGGSPDRQVLPPHVFAGVTNDMAIAQDEIFGPIAPIKMEALHVANQTEYGLSSAVFTRAIRFSSGVMKISTTADGQTGANS